MRPAELVSLRQESGLLGSARLNGAFLTMLSEGAVTFARRGAGRETAGAA